jgi:dsRNA-specific ribonuclease
LTCKDTKIFAISSIIFRIFAKTLKNMCTVTLQYDARNQLAKSIMQSIREAGVFTILEKDRSGYSPEFISKIEQGRTEVRQGKGKAIKTADLWK